MVSIRKDKCEVTKDQNLVMILDFCCDNQWFEVVPEDDALKVTRVHIPFELCLTEFLQTLTVAALTHHP